MSRYVQERGPLLLLGAALLAVFGSTATTSCANPVDDRVILGAVEPDAAAPPPILVATDAGEADAVPHADAGTSMCVSSECAAPYATCPASESLCDTNLAADPKNCGACGNACPSGDWIEYELQARWDCAQGQCKMLCTDSYYRDCDGLVENGCETRIDTVTNCGGCGTVCPDGFQCSPVTRTCFDARCLPPALLCNGVCVDPTSDDYNCGSCGKQCNQSPPGKPKPPFAMYYGCRGSTCEKLKCAPGFEDCDGDEGTGCEINVARDPKNCGECGLACPAGDLCENGKCACDPGPDGCGCKNLATDPDNCGSCGFKCPGADVGGNGRRSCKGGHCAYDCADGYADCNNDRADGCEINTRRDPQHCGSCAVACTTGQSCKDSVCATKPCPEGPVQ
jgi:hypothetical protein